MTFASVITGLFAIAKAVPLVDKWLGQLTGAYIDMQLKKVENVMLTKKDKRHSLMLMAQKATTDAERKTISIALHAISTGRM